MEAPLLNEKSVTLAGAARAVGRPKDTLRGWLDKGGAQFLFSGEGKGWRRFFGADIAIMAIALPMLEFGLRPEFAFKLAREAVMAKAELKGATWAELRHAAAFYATERLLVRHDADRWRAQWVSDRQTVSGVGGPALVLNPCGLVLAALWRLEDKAA